MLPFNSRFLRYLAVIVGSLAAALAAIWWLRRPAPETQTVVPDLAVAPAPLPNAPEPVPSIAPTKSGWGTRVIWVIGAASMGLLAAAAVVFQSATPTAAPPLLVIGAVGLGAALFLKPPTLPSWISAPLQHDPLHRWLVGAGVVCIAALTIINLDDSPSISIHVQLLLLLLGIGLMVGGWGVRLSHISRATLLRVGTITLVALVLRVAALDSAIRFFVDEADYARGTIATIKGGDALPLLARFDSTSAFPWLYPYLEGLSVRLLGRNLIGLRLVSALFGALTIPALYLLARALFDDSIALIAAILLATFPPHLHFSRIALINIADPLFGTLALGWLLWGLRTGKRGYFALAGAALGLTQYFYDGGRLLYPPLLLIWLALGIALAAVRGKNWRDKLDGLLVLLFVAAIIAAPVYVASLARSQPFSVRYDREQAGLSLLNIATLLDRTWGSFLHYLQYKDDSFFYAGPTPLLLVVAAPWFLIGLVVVIWRVLRRDYGGLLLLLWLLLTSMGNALLVLSRLTARYVVVFPALMLLTALGLTVAVQWLLRQKLWARYALGAAVVLIALAQVVYYFGVHVPYYNDQSRLYEDSQDAAFRAADFPPWTQVHIVGDPAGYHGYSLYVMQFLREDTVLDVLSTQDFTPAYLEHLPREVDQAFFLVPADSASQALLRRYFTVTGPFDSPYALPPNREFWLFYAAHTANP